MALYFSIDGLVWVREEFKDAVEACRAAGLAVVGGWQVSQRAPELAEAPPRRHGLLGWVRVSLWGPPAGDGYLD